MLSLGIARSSRQNGALQTDRTAIAFVLGLVVGLGIAVAVALYITNAPMPFVNKVKPAGETVNPAAGGPLPDPNKPLQNTVPIRGGTAPTEPVDPKAMLAPPEKLAPVAPTPADEGTRYLIQAGAFRTPDDADAMRARLALLGFDAKIFPREQDGTTLYRVRLGPYGTLEDVNRIRKTMAENGIDAQLVKIR
jgi:cell division protein FtsN